jgi:hypothetical protein
LSEKFEFLIAVQMKPFFFVDIFAQLFFHISPWEILPLDLDPGIWQICCMKSRFPFATPLPSMRDSILTIPSLVILGRLQIGRISKFSRTCNQSEKRWTKQLFLGARWQTSSTVSKDDVGISWRTDHESLIPDCVRRPFADSFCLERTNQTKMRKSHAICTE